VYEDRERQELTRLDSCEVIDSPLTNDVSYPADCAGTCGLSCWMSCCRIEKRTMRCSGLRFPALEVMRGNDIWMPLTYFELWLTRLTGFAELSV